MTSELLPCRAVPHWLATLLLVAAAMAGCGPRPFLVGTTAYTDPAKGPAMDDPVCFAPPDRVLPPDAGVELRSSYQRVVDSCTVAASSRGVQLVPYAEDGSCLVGVFSAGTVETGAVTTGGTRCVMVYGSPVCRSRSETVGQQSKNLRVTLYRRGDDGKPVEVHARRSAFRTTQSGYGPRDIEALCWGLFVNYPAEENAARHDVGPQMAGEE